MDTEWRACQQSAHYFLERYAYIIDRNTAKIVKWESWPYLVDLLELLSYFHDVILFKARQLGWSWTVGGGYALHKTLFNEGAKTLLLSQGEREAWDLLAKPRFILRHLPTELRLTEKHSDNRSLLDFEAIDSLIEVLPSTDKAGRSTDASLVIRDELSRHPYGGDNFGAIGPTVDAGGQLVDISTIDKLDADNHFTERVNRAMLGAVRKDLPSGLVVFSGGESGAALVFGGWKLRPTRVGGMSLEEWFELRVKPKYSALMIEQEFPETIEDALRKTAVRAFFDVNAIDAMLGYTLRSLSVTEIDTFGGMVKIYKLPVVGEKYCGFTDPSDGKDDPHASVFFHPRTGEEVASSHGKVTADICAKIHDSLVRFYNNAYNSFEENATAGGKFGETLHNLETPNCRGFRKGKPVEKERGWWTGGPTKRDMLWGLEEAVRKHLIIVHTREAIEEMRGFIIPEGSEPQPTKGLHDDYIMAWAGLWQIKKYTPLVTPQIVSFKIREAF